MSWKDRRSWNLEPPKRPARRSLDPEERERLLAALRRAVAKTAVLPGLGVRVVAERGFFHFDRLAPDEPDVWLSMARALPLARSSLLVLEAQNSRGTWFELARGAAPKIVRALAAGGVGTFHGVGPIEARARRSKRHLEPEKIRHRAEGYVYASDGAQASVQEVLFHHFGVPLDIVAEPRQWYEYHRTPVIRETREDRILVSFGAASFGGSAFGGTCLYAKRDGRWGAWTIRPNASASIDLAEEWLGKRRWVPWA